MNHQKTKRSVLCMFVWCAFGDNIMQVLFAAETVDPKCMCFNWRCYFYSFAAIGNINSMPKHTR